MERNFTIAENAAAIVIEGDGTIALIIPEMDASDIVPDNVHITIGIMIALSDDKFRTDMSNLFMEHFDNLKEVIGAAE